SPDNLPDAAATGMPDDLAGRWRALMARCFDAYQREYERLDAVATENPAVVRMPEGAKPAVARRLRKNYALDRARYFVPFATRTNLGLVMSARMWAEAVKHLDSLPQLEARAAAGVIREELVKFAPRLMRHSYADESYQRQAADELAWSVRLGLGQLSAEPLPDEVWMRVDRDAPP